MAGNLKSQTDLLPVLLPYLSQIIEHNCKLMQLLVSERVAKRAAERGAPPLISGFNSPSLPPELQDPHVPEDTVETINGIPKDVYAQLLGSPPQGSIPFPPPSVE